MKFNNQKPITELQKSFSQHVEYQIQSSQPPSDKCIRTESTDENTSFRNIINGVSSSTCNTQNNQYVSKIDDLNDIQDGDFISQKYLEETTRNQPKENTCFLKKILMCDYLKILVKSYQSIKESKMLSLKHIPNIQQKELLEQKYQILQSKLIQLINNPKTDIQNISKFKIISMIILTFKYEIGFLLITSSLYNGLKILFSQILILFLESVSQKSSNSYQFSLALLLSFIQFSSVITAHNISRFFYNFFYVFKVTLMKILYSKIITLSAFSLKQTDVGKIINLVSNDLNTLDNKGLCMIKNITIIFDFLVIALFLYFRLGMPSIFGLCFILCYPLIQAIFAKINQRLFYLKTQLVDQRIKFTNEIIDGIRLIKMYAWEEAFVKFVQTIRNYEITKILAIQVIYTFQQSFTSIVDLLACFISFMCTYYFGDPSSLTVPTMLSVLDLFSFIKFELVTNISTGLTGLLELKVIIQRVLTVLIMQQKSIAKISDTLNSQQILNDEKLPNGTIKMKNFSAFWNRSNSPVLKDINIDINKGDLVAIVGRIGSGKSSLLNCILQEVPFYDGSFSFNGSVAYVEQEPYIYSSSIRENIIFGSEYKEEFYQQVLEACCLNDDLNQLDNQDLTQIGERGASLSGGQRARISLARAIYSQSDIILLDDPLSAVDSKVAKQIIEKAILTMLKDKTVLVVTHHIHFTKKVDKVLIMKEGQICKQGTYEELQSDLNDIFSDCCLNEVENESPQNQIDNQNILEIMKIHNQYSETKFNGSQQQLKKREDILKNNQVKQIFTKEQDENMTVNFKTYQKYFSYSSLKWFLIIAVALFISCEIIYIFYTKTISNYKEEEEEEEDDLMDRLYTLSYLTLIFFVNFLLKYLLFTFIVNSSNRQIYQNMIKSLVRASVLFFDTTPSGRILNKFSTDLGIIDQQITRTMINSIDVLSKILISITTILIINPYFTIVFIIQLVLTLLFVNFCKPSLQQSKQLDLRYSSPIYTCFNQTIQGVLPIKTYKKQNLFLNSFTNILQNSLKATLIFNFNQRAFSIYIHLATVLFSNIGMYIIMIINNDSNSLGQAIVFFISISNALQFGLRMIIETDISMSSAQRAMNLIEIAQEPKLRSEKDQVFLQNKQSLDEKEDNSNQIYNFPKKGVIEFFNVKMKYRKDLSYVLNGLSFKIKAGEKVGFVGRTGAGKSSIIQALYRMIEIEEEMDEKGQFGYIKIDGYNSKELGIHTIRQGISIIPQIPFVFSGSIRRNLDPLNQFSDSEVTQIIQEIGLSEKVLKLKEGFFTDMSNSNGVFSSGEKQLICLGRAILRQSKIILLDEATANCDLETDKIIQQKIRDRFKNSTVITIAHRLNTIADYDKIFVLENGKVIEQGEPYDLLLQENGDFRQMALQTGQNNFNQIVQLAQNSTKKT